MLSTRVVADSAKGQAVLKPAGHGLRFNAGMRLRCRARLASRWWVIPVVRESHERLQPSCVAHSRKCSNDVAELSAMSAQIAVIEASVSGLIALACLRENRSRLSLLLSPP